MDKEMDRQKNWGIELMRILCMLMIVVYHILGHGGVLNSPQISPKGYILAGGLKAMCFCAVDGYAMISGYVGVEARYRYSAVALLWLRAFLYSAGITAGFALAMPESGAGEELVQFMFPVMNNVYWYFTAYVGCFFLAPLVRAALRGMSRRQAGVWILGMLALFSVAPSAAGSDPFSVISGYSPLWLMILYACGAYIRRYPVPERVPQGALAAVFLLSGALLYGLALLGERTGFALLGGEATYKHLMRYDSPLVLLGAAALLVFCARLRVPRGRRAIRFFAASSFSVYLIHDHPYVRRFLISAQCYKLAALHTVSLVPALLAVAAGIYLLCAGVDALRSRIFDALRLRARLEALEERALRGIWSGL